MLPYTLRDLEDIAFTHAIPKNWRLVTIEDMPELIGLRQPVLLERCQSVAKVTAKDLVEAAPRMSMDRLLNQELRNCQRARPSCWSRAWIGCSTRRIGCSISSKRPGWTRRARLRAAMERRKDGWPPKTKNNGEPRKGGEMG